MTTYPMHTCIYTNAHHCEACELIDHADEHKGCEFCEVTHHIQDCPAIRALLFSDDTSACVGFGCVDGCGDCVQVAA